MTKKNPHELLIDRPIGDKLREWAPRFHAIGYYRTAEVVWADARVRKAMHRYLGMPDKEIADAMQAGWDDVTNSASFPPPVKHDYFDDRTVKHFTAPDMVAMSTGAGTAPPVDLAHPIRNQTPRQNCSIFAAVAAYERALALKNGTYTGGPNMPPKYEDFSEDHLSWRCWNAEHPGDNPTIKGEGWGVIEPMEMIRDKNLATNILWPQRDAPQKIPEVDAVTGGTSPPSNLQVIKLAEQLRSRPDDLACLICEQIEKKRYVAVSFPIYRSSLDNEYAMKFGLFLNPIPREPAIGRHSVCLISFKNLPDRGLGGGRFLVRNSYGIGWGGETAENDYRWGYSGAKAPAGYGTIPYSYVNDLAFEASTIEL